MTKYLKNVDRVRSLVRGMEADVKEMERATEKSFNKTKARIKKKLEELSSEITNLYGFLEDSTISPIEVDKRKNTIEDFESAQRLIENKLNVIEASPKSYQCTRELLMDEEKTIDDLLKSTSSIKVQTSSIGSELTDHNSLLAEIDNEVGGNLGIIENGIKKLGILTNYTTDRCLMITTCVLFFILVLLMVN